MKFLKLTNCAIIKAAISRRPGRSRKDQLLDRVTKMSAWLTMLTWRYTAAVSSCGLSLMDLTPNFSCKRKQDILNLHYIIEAKRKLKQLKTVGLQCIDTIKGTICKVNVRFLLRRRLNYV